MIDVVLTSISTGVSGVIGIITALLRQAEEGGSYKVKVRTQLTILDCKDIIGPFDLLTNKYRLLSTTTLSGSSAAAARTLLMSGKTCGSGTARPSSGIITTSNTSCRGFLGQPRRAAPTSSSRKNSLPSTLSSLWVKRCASWPRSCSSPTRRSSPGLMSGPGQTAWMRRDGRSISVSRRLSSGTSCFRFQWSAAPQVGDASCCRSG